MLSLLLVILSCALCSCASVSQTQSRVDRLALSRDFDQALNILQDPKSYGKNNELLYLLDKGLVLHLAGDYEQSVEVFQAAKETYDELYTESVSQMAASWLWNDYALAYRGEDFERVMINVFQAVNYAALGDLQAALVEARDVDSTLNAINAQYPSGQENVYRDDAFVRLLMGLFYEAAGRWSDALVSYRLSWQVYGRDYEKYYKTNAPLVLKENLLAAADALASADADDLRREFSDVRAIPVSQKKDRGEIILIEYQGLSPRKVPVQVPVPLPDGYITQVAFPAYQKRNVRQGPSTLSAGQPEGGITYTALTELGQNIEAIAVKNLDDRKARVIAKSALRAAGKYVAQRSLERNVQKQRGDGGADAVRIIGSLFNLVSEQADLRSWQTLPGQIRIGRLVLAPGQYAVFVNEQEVDTVELAAGEKKFLVVRTFK